MKGFYWTPEFNPTMFNGIKLEVDADVDYLRFMNDNSELEEVPIWYDNSDCDDTNPFAIINNKRIDLTELLKFKRYTEDK